MAVMSITLEQHAPRARCYVCGSTVTTSLCHHCGKVMCGDHSSRVVDEAGKPLSEEFTELGLEEPGGYHCYACAHTVRGRLRALIAVGVAVAVLGVIVTVFSVLPGVALLLVGAGLAAYGYFADKRRRALALESRPLLPLVPNLDFASVSEVLHGKLSLSQEGMYESRATPVEGKINIAMTLAMSDRELLKRYRKKYRLTDDDGVKFSAGFAVLAGEVGLDAVPNPIQGVNPIPGGTGMSFGGKIAGHPFFTPTHSQSGGHWNLDLPYKLQAPRNVGHIPLWLTPALLPESDQRTLELDLQWMKLGPLDMDRIESIVLD